ncbi:DNA polymerase [Selenomonas dianae]|uniref:DNA-directed DNA polymerase n=1 Tax=Selenomonas dianae TaxID=135079 RepID=A0ABN0SV69_9FIRM|nr:DNA polymerase [Selenomonas dianae]WLD83264.1 DNA polymerase [Selenomonas dianae]
MKSISIDIETFSSVPLAKAGVYKYAEAEDFEILLFGYFVDGGEVQVVDLENGEEIPKEILAALTDETVTKWAFNAMFERVCLSRHLGIHLKPNAWCCSMIWAATLGLPLSLKEVGTVLRLDRQKLEEGKDLIRYFCVPCKASKSNGGRTRNLPADAPEKWELFKEYNKRDVETEMEIQARLKKFPVSESEWENYVIDQEINDRGISVDTTFVSQAIRCDERSKVICLERAQNLTGLENPNSPLQLMDWLHGKGLFVESLAKSEVSKMLKTAVGDVREVLELRQRLAKTSIKKYMAMEAVTGADHRARGLFQFYGANRTGRFAGRLIQLQNLPQNHLTQLKAVRTLVKDGNFDLLDMLYDSTSDVLSQLIRTSFVPQSGCRFIVADYSAIEARVLAWLAGERWVLDVFQKNGDIYCETASRMFHCKVEKHGENGDLRQKGKQAVLSCGYGGSVGALIAMGAVESGMKEEELQPLVDLWRVSNPHIVQFWWDVDRAVKTCVKQHIEIETHGVCCTYKSGVLFIRLPSGRELAYAKPRIGENRFGRESVTYEGLGMTKKWERIETFGGKLVENITQATACDLLVFAMKQLRNRGFDIVMHVHDEIVLEVPHGVSSVEEICSIMAENPPWAKGLPLKADGYACEFYRKD